MHELSIESYKKVSTLLSEVSHYLVLQTILDGRTPGKIWVNNIEAITAALVWDKLNTFFYLLGVSIDNQFNQDLRSLIVSTILPEADQLGYRNFYLLPTSQAWEDQIGTFLKGFNPVKQSINAYTLTPDQTDTLLSGPSYLPAGYELKRITPELLNHAGLGNLDEVIYCINACWGRTDNYLQNNGVGFCILTDNAVASWCSTDYIFGDECELYVETFEGHKQNGLGTMAARACIRECLTRDLTVYWHCFGDNAGSIRIAEKTGFSKISESPVFVVDLSSLRSL